MRTGGDRGILPAGLGCCLGTKRKLELPTEDSSAPTHGWTLGRSGGRGSAYTSIRYTERLAAAGLELEAMYCQQQNQAMAA